VHSLILSNASALVFYSFISFRFFDRNTYLISSFNALLSSAICWIILRAFVWGCIVIYILKQIIIKFQKNYEHIRHRNPSLKTQIDEVFGSTVLYKKLEKKKLLQAKPLFCCSFFKPLDNSTSNSAITHEHTTLNLDQKDTKHNQVQPLPAIYSKNSILEMTGPNQTHQNLKMEKISPYFVFPDSCKFLSRLPK